MQWVLAVLVCVMFYAVLYVGASKIQAETQASASGSDVSALPQQEAVLAFAEQSQEEAQQSPYIIDADYVSEYYIVVYTGSQSVVVYSKDSHGSYTNAEKVFTCSTGLPSSPTRTGVYKVWRRFEWRLLVGDVYGQYSTSISSSYLFHSVPYESPDPSTIIDAEYDKLGTPASHGCIRLSVEDAKWIYDNIPNGTQVNVTEQSGPRGEAVKARKAGAQYSGWDPTDRWAQGNPYFE